MYPYVHSSIIYNSQDTETTSVLPDGQMKKIYTHTHTHTYIHAGIVNQTFLTKK